MRRRRRRRRTIGNKKLDGVGPVDNRHSTYKLHHFVKKRRRINKKNKT